MNSTRFCVLAATLGITACIFTSTWLLLGDFTFATVLFLAMQTVLVSLIAFSFCVAGAGFLSLLSNRRAGKPAEVDFATGRTAVLVPVYNENPERVFARVEAMRRALNRAKATESIDFVVLSDTRSADIIHREEKAFEEARHLPCGSSIYYRRREQNVGRKAGNLQDFCQRWGVAYDYLVVLDADSLMTGETLLAMIRRIEANPQLGLIQTVPCPINQKTLWGRSQQFAAAAYGPIYSEGYRRFCGDSGNYWGHNAIIRRQAFVDHCGLPILPGKAPLGGEILSHDFIEAALMLRAGYGVRIDTDLGGSFEECPTNLPAHATRDRRWCQGNLQHLSIAIMGDLRPMSRFHLAIGVLSYISSPFWLLLLLLGFVVQAGDVSKASTAPLSWLQLFVIIMTLLLLPRVLAFLEIVLHQKARLFGGVLRLAASVLVETGVSVLTAPIFMLFHTRFVVTTLAGKVVRWSAQERDGSRLSWKESVHTHWWQTLAGVIATLVVAILRPDLLVWLGPVIAGLLVSVPLSVILSDETVGNAAAQRGVLRTPSETHPPDEVVEFCNACPIK
ncbi:MAG: glucans biosynthesis glucosyltransferase MdoH [Planctomycetota bacterium]